MTYLQLMKELDDVHPSDVDEWAKLRAEEVGALRYGEWLGVVSAIRTLEHVAENLRTIGAAL